MGLRTVVVIREDPFKSHRAVEALRIALGLSAGEHPVTVVLLDRAAGLLGQERDETVDGDILEKHFPVLKDLAIPFVIEKGASARFGVDPQLKVTEDSPESISALLRSADRTLVF